MGLIDIPTDGTVLVVGFTSDGSIDDRVTTLPAILASITQQSWSDLRGQLTASIRDRLNGQRIAEGMNLYDVVVNLAADCAMSMSRSSAGDLTVSVVTGRNTVIASTTTDTIFGAYADPRFSLDFGLAFTYEIDLPPVAGPVSVTGFKDLRITMPHLDSQNLIGDIALFFAAVVEFFTGWNVDGTLARMLDQLDLASGANNYLGPLNGAVTDLAASGFAYLNVLAGDPADLARQLGPWAAAAGGVLGGLPGGTQSLMLMCRKPDTSGVIEGEISWPVSDGGPVDRRLASILSNVASLQVNGGVVERATRRLEAAQVTPDVSFAQLLATEGALSPELEQTAIAVAALPIAGTLQLGAISAPEAIRVWDSAVQPDPEFVPTDLFGAMNATALETFVGSRLAYEAITDEFRRGPNQFDLTVIAPDAGGGHPTGRLVGTWYDESEGWHRRRFRIEDVETDVPLQVSCALAANYVWSPEGPTDIAPRNWDGTVTVRPPIDFATAIREGSLQATVVLANGERRTSSIATLEAAGALRPPDGAERSIIIVGGVPGDEVSLNPQPLPPRVMQAIEELHAGHSVMLAASVEGNEVSLNPQPLPPRWREVFLERFEGHRVVIRERGLEEVLVREPADEFAVERLGGGIGRFAGRLRAERLGGIAAHQLEVERQRQVERELEFQIERQIERRAEWQIEHQIELEVEREIELQAGRQALAGATETVVDRFGDLTIPRIDPDVFIPDVHNPTGHGTVRGVDFRVHPA